MRSAPKIDSFFRPEEEHGRSRKNDIVPPMRDGHSEMRDVWFQNRLVVSNFDRQGLASVAVGCRNDRIGMQRCRNAVCVPNAIREVTPSVRVHRKCGRDSRKWRSHSNAGRIARLRNQQPLYVKTRERRTHLIFCYLGCLRDFNGAWNRSAIGSDAIDSELNFCVEFVRGHETNLISLKVLHRFFVFLGCGLGLERAEVPTFAGLSIFLS
jgi:hypothetical protein